MIPQQRLDEIKRMLSDARVDEHYAWLCSLGVHELLAEVERLQNNPVMLERIRRLIEENDELNAECERLRDALLLSPERKAELREKLRGYLMDTVLPKQGTLEAHDG